MKLRKFELNLENIYLLLGIMNSLIESNREEEILNEIVSLKNELILYTTSFDEKNDEEKYSTFPVPSKGVLELFEDLGIYDDYFDDNFDDNFDGFPDEIWESIGGFDDHSDRYLSEGTYIKKDGTVYSE